MLAVIELGRPVTLHSDLTGWRSGGLQRFRGGNHQTTGLSSAWPSQCLIVSSLDTGVGAWRWLVKCLWQQMNEMRKEEEEEEEEEEGGQLKRDLK